MRLSDEDLREILRIQRDSQGNILQEINFVKYDMREKDHLRTDGPFNIHISVNLQTVVEPLSPTHPARLGAT